MSMDAEGTESPTTNEVEGEVEHAECMEPILEEGTYVKSKLIHTSTKLFWRYKATYEFHFFELLETDLIQLICLDHESNEEPHHMFLSFSALKPVVEEDAKKQLDARVKKMAGIRSRAPQGTCFKDSDAMLYQDILKKAAAEYIINHFHVEKDNTTGETSCKLVPLAAEGEQGMRALTLMDRPEQPTDARVNRKKRNSTTEINALMKDLRAETSSLKQATDQATRWANLGKMAVGGFKAAMQSNKRLRSKSIDVTNMTPARLRWQKAIHRVILQNAVAQYTEVIAKSRCCNPNRVDTPTRMRGNRSTFPATDGFLPISKPGTPTKAKPSPLGDVGGFGETSGFGATTGFGSTASVTTKRKQSTRLTSSSLNKLTTSNSMPLPVLDSKSPDTPAQVGSISPPKNLHDDKLPSVSPNKKVSPTVTKARRHTSVHVKAK